jgi:DNA polymerase III subunit epsilon
MSKRFVVIDFETANADLASICQIGIASFVEGALTEVWGSLVDPEDYFDDVNVSIHGISETVVKGAPKFVDLFGQLTSRLQGQIVVSHSSFDRAALQQTTRKHKLTELQCVWLDSARVVRRTWPQFAWRGYGLENVCKTLGVQFKHHDAAEDARAAGEVLLHAMRVSGMDLQAWTTRVKQPIDIYHVATDKSITATGNADGPLYGEEMVFTGALSIKRREAAELAARLGCTVAETVKRTTTILVVGDQDVLRLAGHEKSAKHRRAENLAAEGQRIRFLRESDFLQLTGTTS